MFEHVTSSDRNVAIQRLTALWALNECGLGGILHALNSPFTGLLVGSLAMVCIAFICALADNKWKAVLGALIVVLVIKALVSPHSSPTAYVAVAFQAITGALIYRFIPFFMVASLFFLSLGLLESAMQRLIMLTLLYGNTLWEAVDIWGKYVTDRWGVLLPLKSSTLVIYTYLAIHLVVGLLIGYFVTQTIRAVNKLWGDDRFQLTLQEEDKKSFFDTGKGKRKLKWKPVVLFAIMVLVIAFAYSGLIGSEAGWQKGLIAVIRAIVLLVLWYVFLAPLFIRILRNFLSKKHQQFSTEVSRTMDLFPYMLWIVDKAWKESKSLGWWKRWKTFTLHTLLYTLQFQLPHDPTADRSDAKF